jgi:hypothetical protein
MASIIVWRQFANPYLLRLVKAIYPNLNEHKIQYQPLVVLVDIMNIISLAYQDMEEEIELEKNDHAKNLHVLLEVFYPALRDYYFSLRTNDWDLFDNCRDVLIYILIFGKQNLYAQAEILQSTLFKYWEKSGKSIFKIITSNIGMFNEEIGEIAFSFLSRNTHTYPENKLLSKKNEQFVMISRIMEAYKAFSVNSKNVEKRRNSYVVDDGRVQRCKMELETMIDEINSNSFHSLSIEISSKKNKAFYKINSAEVILHTTPPKKLWIEDTNTAFTNTFKKLKSNFFKKRTMEGLRKAFTEFEGKHKD